MVETPSDRIPGAEEPATLGLVAGALLVFTGGFIGTLVRYTLTITVPIAYGWPLATLIVNITGSFALGGLMGALDGSTPTIKRHRIRLLIGTGLIGVYTTYSTLAVETERLLSQGRPGTAMGYAGLSVVAGLAAALLGTWLTSRHLTGTSALTTTSTTPPPVVEKDDER